MNKKIAFYISTYIQSSFGGISGFTIHTQQPNWIENMNEIV